MSRCRTVRANSIRSSRDSPKWSAHEYSFSLRASTDPGLTDIATYARRVARKSSFAGDTLVLSPMLLAAGEVDRSFYRDAACRQKHDGTPGLAWTAELKRSYQVGPNVFSGHKLIQMACIICKGCPVQWDCARAAIVASEPVGTWADKHENIAWLGKRSDWKRILDRAEHEQTPVQVAIRNTRSRM